METGNFKVGDKVQLHWEGHDLHGATGTISEISSASGSVGVMFDGIGYDRWYSPARLIPVTPEPQQEESPEHTIAELTNALYEASVQADHWQKLSVNYRDDLGHFENVMREQKIEQGWCDEGTNKVIAELNGGFTRWQIEPYEQEYEVEVSIDVRVSTSYTVTISASSEEAAYDYFNDDPDSYIDSDTLHSIVSDELAYGNAEIDMSA